MMTRYRLSLIKSGLFVLLVASSALGAKANSADKSTYVFNLSGSLNGFGDVSGPLWTIIKLKKIKPTHNYYVVVDTRAKSAIETMYAETLDTVAHKLGVHFIPKDRAAEIPPADFSFELFFGGRKIHVADGYNPFTDLIYTNDKTITIISDTMHGNTLDEVIGPNFHIYFKPPGIGTERSGIIDSPDLPRLVGKTLEFKRAVAAGLFDNDALEALILKKSAPDAKFSFLYGAHNEIYSEQLIGQTKDFAEALKSNYPSSPIIIFTPNSKEELERVGVKSTQILELNDLTPEPQLRNKLYFLSLGKRTSFQFMALMAIADVPILVEGNNSVSTAIRLEKDFLVYRSRWNAPQIKDLLELDGPITHSHIYDDIYDLEHLSLPQFFHYFEKEQGRKIWVQYSLSAHTPDFPTKLAQVLDFAEKLTHPRPDYIALAKASLKKTHDAYLAYSIVLDGFKHDSVDPSAVNVFQEQLAEQGLDFRNLEARFIPNKPNFSEKIEALEKQNVTLQVINLERSPERRARMEKELAQITHWPHHFIKAIEGKYLNTQELRQKGIYATDVTLKPGELGIFMTTLEKVLPQAAAATPGSVIVTFEDDVTLPPNFTSQLHAALLKAPHDWDILYLGCNQNHFSDSVGLVSTQKDERFSFELCPSSALQHEGDHPWAKITSSRCIAGNWAYALNPLSAAKLSREIVPIRKALDNSIADLVGSGKINAYCATPELVSIDIAVESTIR